MHKSDTYTYIKPLRSGWTSRLWQILRLLLLPAILLLVVRCEQVIDVELNDARPRLVIEGNLTKRPQELNVTVTRTGPYFGEGTPETVEDAEVTLEDDAGNRWSVPSAGSGNYRLAGLRFNPGTTYRLHVEHGDVTYSAASTLQPQVKIDSLSYEYIRETRFFDGGYRLMVYFVDRMGQEDYYRIKVYRNGQLLNGVDDLIVFEDDELDGRVIRVHLRRQVFLAGDSARVDLMALDRSAWLYFSSLREMADPHPGSPAPANPVSNFTNGALGYFSAWTYSTKKVAVNPVSD